MRAELLNHSLPDRVPSLAVQKSTFVVAEILFLTMQAYDPPEPSARVDVFSRNRKSRLGLPPFMATTGSHCRP